MIERSADGKARSQDAVGVLFCLMGGFSAVSIVLAMRGSEPSNAVARVLTFFVIELMQLLGHWAALALSVGVAALGALLVLRSEPLSSGRPLVAVASCSAGLSLLLGAFGAGGSLGAVFPGLVDGFTGRALASVLGLAVVWIGATLLPLATRKRERSAEAVQRIGLSMRSDPAGVSPAEAALLVTDLRPPRPPAPPQDPSLRPFNPLTREQPARNEPRPKPAEAAVPVPTAAPLRAPRSQPAPVPPSPVEPSALELKDEPPPSPSWESASSVSGDAEDVEDEIEAEDDAAEIDADDEDEVEDKVEDEVEVASAALEDAETESAPGVLAAELARAFETEEVEEELETTEAELVAEPAGAADAPPRAAWEQIGLFDEEESLEAVPPPAKPARSELTPSFDFEPAPARAAHEPELPLETAEDPFAVEDAPSARAAQPSTAAAQEEEEEEEEEVDEEEDEEADERAELESAATLAPAPPPPNPPAREAPAKPADFVLAPAAPAPKPAVAAGEEGAGWSQLVFEAGCVILEQKRVAVSMLERRFGIDFDQACRVLDELQEAGLIGPYIGGRTRDILLSREEWLAHAPQA